MIPLNNWRYEHCATFHAQGLSTKKGDKWCNQPTFWTETIVACQYHEGKEQPTSKVPKGKSSGKGFFGTLGNLFRKKNRLRANTYSGSDHPPSRAPTSILRSATGSPTRRGRRNNVHFTPPTATSTQPRGASGRGEPTRQGGQLEPLRYRPLPPTLDNPLPNLNQPFDPSNPIVHRAGRSGSGDEPLRYPDDELDKWPPYDRDDTNDLVATTSFRDHSPPLRGDSLSNCPVSSLLSPTPTRANPPTRRLVPADEARLQARLSRPFAPEPRNLWGSPTPSPAASAEDDGPRSPTSRSVALHLAAQDPNQPEDPEALRRFWDRIQARVAAEEEQEREQEDAEFWGMMQERVNRMQQDMDARALSQARTESWHRNQDQAQARWDRAPTLPVASSHPPRSSPASSSSGSIVRPDTLQPREVEVPAPRAHPLPTRLSGLPGPAGLGRSTTISPTSPTPRSNATSYSFRPSSPQSWGRGVGYGGND